jgi:hypothetical protein
MCKEPIIDAGGKRQRTQELPQISLARRDRFGRQVRLRQLIREFLEFFLIRRSEKLRLWVAADEDVFCRLELNNRRILAPVTIFFWAFAPGASAVRKNAAALSRRSRDLIKTGSNSPK